MTALHVLLLGILAEIAIRVVPLRRVTDWLRLDMTFENEPPAKAPGPALTETERRRARAVLRVMRNWPFGSGACLRQALVLGFLLRRHAPVLQIGVRRLEGKAIAAHAWLHVQGGTIGLNGPYESLRPLARDSA